MSTLEAINLAVEAAQRPSGRSYLGASSIGKPCERSLWYSFRSAADPQFEAKSIFAIEDGFAGEDVMIKRLRMVPGVTLNTIDVQTHKQIGVVALGGHLRGHLDGVIKGLIEAPEDWHVWEHKQVNQQKFEKLGKLIEKDPDTALEKWDSVYYAQGQVYMGQTGVHNHFITVGSPGGRQYHAAFTKFSQQAFDVLMAKAERIINAAEPPQRISEDRLSFTCMWCDFSEVCHGDTIPRKDCRTCVSAQPVMDGNDAQWKCIRWDSNVPAQHLRDGCDDHVFSPVFLTKKAQVVDAGTNTKPWISYKHESGLEFVQGGKACDPKNGLVLLESSMIAGKSSEVLRDTMLAGLVKTFGKVEVLGIQESEVPY